MAESSAVCRKSHFWVWERMNPKEIADLIAMDLRVRVRQQEREKALAEKRDQEMVQLYSRRYRQRFKCLAAYVWTHDIRSQSFPILRKNPLPVMPERISSWTKHAMIPFEGNDSQVDSLPRWCVMVYILYVLLGLKKIGLLLPLIQMILDFTDCLIGCFVSSCLWILTRDYRYVFWTLYVYLCALWNNIIFLLWKFLCGCESFLIFCERRIPSVQDIEEELEIIYRALVLAVWWISTQTPYVALMSLYYLKIKFWYYVFGYEEHLIAKLIFCSGIIYISYDHVRERIVRGRIRFD